MTWLRHTMLAALALAVALFAAPGAQAEKEKLLLKTKAKAAHLTPDGKILAAASADNVRVVYLAIKKSRLIEKKYYPIVLSPDGKFLGVLGPLVTEDDQTVPVYDLATLKAGGAVVMPTVGGLAFCLAPGGKMCAFGTLKDLVLMDVPTGAAKHTFKGLGGQPWTASFSLDGKFLACGTDKDQVHVWQVATRQPVHKLKVPGTVVQSVAFSPDGKLLAASADEAVKVWDITSGKEVHSFRGPRDKLMRGLAFGANGAVLATACSDGTVALRDMANGKTLDTINVGAEAYRVSLSADGRVLVVTAGDEFARVYDVSAITAGLRPR